MDDTSSSRAGLAKNVDMRHNIVADNGFLGSGSINFLVGDANVLLHLLNGFLSDGSDSKLLLGNSEVEPKLTPCGISVAKRKARSSPWRHSEMKVEFDTCQSRTLQ